MILGTHLRAAVVLCWFAIPALGGITYKVTLNPDACHEVHLPRLTKPSGIAYVDSVSTGYCRYEIRTAGENRLYITASCGGIGKDKFVPVREKYAVDLSRLRGAARRIEEETWQEAQELTRSGIEILDKLLRPRDGELGVRYKGHLLERTGPAWHGIGEDAYPALLSQTNGRVALNSWMGDDITYTFLDPSSAFKRNKVKGRYWIDLYETNTGIRLLKIQGNFNVIEPIQILQPPAWFSDRYYVMPLGVGLKHLLICDVDAAGRESGDSVLKRRK